MKTLKHNIVFRDSKLPKGINWAEEHIIKMESGLKSITLVQYLCRTNMQATGFKKYHAFVIYYNIFNRTLEQKTSLFTALESLASTHSFLSTMTFKVGFSTFENALQFMSTHIEEIKHLACLHDSD